jgi:hypothetical protein
VRVLGAGVCSLGLLTADCCGCHTLVPVLCDSIAVLVHSVTQQQGGSHSRLATG